MRSEDYRQPGEGVITVAICFKYDSWERWIANIILSNFLKLG